jgi:hypothetical protein
MNSATAWWLVKLTCYDAMPNESGVIVADISTCVVTYNEEYLPECEMLSLSAGDITTWYEGRKRALLILAEQMYGVGTASFKLRVRAKDGTFKECA